MDYEHVITVLSQKLKPNKKLFSTFGALSEYLQSDNVFIWISGDELYYIQIRPPVL